MLETVSGFAIAFLAHCRVYGITLVTAMMLATIIFDHTLKEDK